MIKVTLQLKNGLAATSPNGCLHLSLPAGSSAADLRRSAMAQLASHEACERLASAPLLVAGRPLDDHTVLTETQLEVSLAAHQD